MAYEQLDLIEEVTRNDGSKYYEISNIDQNGIAELAVDRGLIKKVRILQLNWLEQRHFNYTKNILIKHIN